MTAYRKKPVVIQAVRVPNDPREFMTVETLEFMKNATWTLAPEGVNIFTLEGTMLASPGDWIIKGVKGEFYPCKPDIFEATYEEVEEGLVEKFQIGREAAPYTPVD